MLKPAKSLLERLYFVTDSDLKTRVSHLYHENSKAGAFRASFGVPAGFERQLVELQRKTGARPKDYPYTKQTLLPVLSSDGHESSLFQSFARRRCERDLREDSLSIDDLSFILRLGSGVTGQRAIAPDACIPLRSYPSAGALYPVEIYLFARAIHGLTPGIYHYHPIEARLAFLSELPGSAELKDAFLGEEMVEKASGIVVMTAVLPRSEIKYGERAYRYAHLEAGHLAQNLILAAGERGLSAVPVGGIFERKVENLLEVDGVEEIAIYSLFVGRGRK